LADLELTLILDKAKVEYGKKAKELSMDEENKIRGAIEQGGFKIEGDLKREVGGKHQALERHQIIPRFGTSDDSIARSANQDQCSNLEGYQENHG
jgi:hypothetical protein